MNSPEFAETYSRGERIRFALIGIVVGALALGVWKLWALPGIAGFADTAPCRTVFGINGAIVLWFGLFVGLPMLFAIVLAIEPGRHGLAILRDGQYPPRGAKVLRPVRIRRGTSARWIGYLHLLAFTPLVAVGIWGYGKAVALSHMSGMAHCHGQPEGRHAHMRDR
ncbi:DUF4407 domain-containing protein [Frateuria edaphi]|uniref:DUF4407 domain-containing protein n=1 Tax=Frateuria edaphi TaxID=2898793 RepID=UPI001E618B98|nr:DUF4407 domain-containing protein [Frateuria edaphi]UGB45245.1 DUF4407 domain-containing protein [Frateuria edaphi]